MRKLLLCMCVLLLAGCPQQGPAPAGGKLAGGQSAAPVNKSAGKQPAPPEPARPGASIKPAEEKGPPVEVWADPVLIPVLEALEPDFQKIYAPGYELDAKERGDLLARLDQEGGPATPAVLCADSGVLEAYCAGGFALSETLRTFAGDRLVLAERPGTGYKSPSLFDIYELRFKALGLGETSTLAGYFGEQALISEGVLNRIADRVQRFPTMTALVDALKLDEVQAILVPASAAAVDGISAWLVIGEDLHEDIRYQAAAGQGQADAPGAAELLRFLAEDEGVQRLLEGYGLVGREVALVEDR